MMDRLDRDLLATACLLRMFTKEEHFHTIVREIHGKTATPPDVDALFKECGGITTQCHVTTGGTHMLYMGDCMNASRAIHSYPTLQN